MDGYALRLADLGTDAAGSELPLGDESRAGSGLPSPLPPGHAVRIFTGAPVPSGADAIVMQEDTSRTERGVRIHVRPALHAHLRRRGSDLRSGSVALAAGSCVARARSGCWRPRSGPRCACIGGRGSRSCARVTSCASWARRGVPAASSTRTHTRWPPPCGCAAPSHGCYPPRVIAWTSCKRASGTACAQICCSRSAGCPSASTT